MKVILESKLMAAIRCPVEVGDSVRTLKELKEKIEKTLLIPKASQILYFNGNLLGCDADLIDVKHGSVIKFRVAGDNVYPAYYTPPPRNRISLSSSSPATPAAVDADKISLELQYRWKSVMPAPVEVRRSDMVRELRTRLEAMNFKVPGNREYCFYHNHILLDEDRSFVSQNVANGDIIYIISNNWLTNDTTSS